MRNYPIILLILLALVLPTIGADCVSDSGSTNPPPRDDRNADRRDERHPDEHLRVPDRADLVAEGKGDLVFKSDVDGHVWVQNRKDERTLLGRTRILRGQSLKISPEADRIWLDDDTLSRDDLSRGDTHRVFVLPDRRFEDRRDKPAPEPHGPINWQTEKQVPKGGRLVREARGSDLSFKADADGSVYLYNADKNEVVKRFDLRKGQRLTVDPTTDSATLDTKQVFKSDLSTKTTYKLYFVPQN
jgi:hypothetical protein